MPSLQDNPAFLADYERLKDATLKPARHAAASAHEHSELFCQRVKDAWTGMLAHDAEFLARLELRWALSSAAGETIAIRKMRPAGTLPSPAFWAFDRF